MKHLAKIQTEFLKYSNDAQYFLDQAIKRNDRKAINYWLKILNRRARKKYPAEIITNREFQELKKRPNDKIEIDKVKKEAIKKFEQLGFSSLPVRDIKPLQELTDVDKRKVLKNHNGVPKYGFTVNGNVYLNMKVIDEGGEFTLEDVVYHELGHHVFHSQYQSQIIEIMNKYGLDEDYDEDFAELFSYKMTGKLNDESLKMYKVFRDFESDVLGNIKTEFEKYLSDTISDDLRGLPFITSVNIGRDFYDNYQVVAEDERVSGLNTRINVNLSDDHVEFNTISVNKKDRGKGYSSAMVKVINDAILGSEKKDIPVYVSDPRDQNFWEHMKDKFPKLNWRI